LSYECRPAKVLPWLEWRAALVIYLFSPAVISLQRRRGYRRMNSTPLAPRLVNEAEGT
jgi:hypothetical protein